MCLHINMLLMPLLMPLQFPSPSLARPSLPVPRSACRAVWYCGAACLHADWRAGHKRVCKALGAARAAAKAARRQVAEAVGEGQAV